MKRIFAVLVLLAAAVPATAATGSSVNALKDFVLGPVMYLVMAIGVLATLYAWIRRKKEAAIFILVAMVFLAFSREMLQSWFGDSTNAWTGSVLDGGDFPIYGKTPAVQVPGEWQSYDDVRSWGYIGLIFCREISGLFFRLGIPIMVAAIGAMVTYYRISVKHEAGSMLGYFIRVVMVGAFCVFPTVKFASKDAERIQQNDVIKSISVMNTSIATDGTNSGTRKLEVADGSLIIPILPAFLLIGGTDLTEAIGAAINKNPMSAYPSMLLRSARNAQLPDQWFAEYRDFSAQCAAAQKGFVEGEKGNSNAMYSSDRQSEGAEQGVNGASLNLLSRWGDNLMAWIPVHGYTINDVSDVSSIRSIEGTIGADKLIKFQESAKNYWSIPSDIPDGAKLQAVFNQSWLSSGLPEDYANIKIIPQIEVAWNLQTWQLPAHIPTFDPPRFFFSPPDKWAVPYCSVPLASNSPTSTAQPFILHISRANGSNSPVTGWSQLGNGVTNESAYLTEIAQSLAVPSANAQPYDLTIVPIDWGDQMRSRLLGQYTRSFCKSAAGNPAHKYYWGCMVSGAFIQLDASHPGKYETSAKNTQVFYGQLVDGITYVNYAEKVHANLYHLTTETKPRDVTSLSASAVSGADISTWNPAAKRAAVDIIMGAPGNYSQNKLATDAFTLPKDTDISFWNFLEMLPKAALWLLSIFVDIAGGLVSFLWPHFMGVALLLFLAIYPIFGIIALWRWTILLDWARGLLWVLMWAPVVTIGHAFSNAGSYLTQEASFQSAMAGPGQALLSLVGICLILMAPVIANAFINPSFDTLSKLGTSVYGTGFQVIGVATRLAVSVGGAALSAVGAKMAGGTVAGGAAGAPGGAAKSAAANSRAAASPRLVGRAVAATGRAGIAVGSRASGIAGAALAMTESLGAARINGGIGFSDHDAKNISDAGSAMVGTALSAGARLVRGIIPHGTNGSGSAYAQKEEHASGPFTGSALSDLIESGQREHERGQGPDADTKSKIARSGLAGHAAKFHEAIHTGNHPAAVNSAQGASTYHRAHAQALAMKGDYQGAGEHMKAHADAESFVARNSHQPDFEHAAQAHRQSMGVARDVERHGLATGNSGMVQAARRMQSDLRATEAGTMMAHASRLEDNGRALRQDADSAEGHQRHALLRESAANYQQAGGLRQRARVGAREAMLGYSAALQEVEQSMMTAAPRAQMNDEASLRSVVGSAAGLSSLSHQAAQLNQRTGQEIPPNLRSDRISLAIERAAGDAGPVGSSILAAISASSAGNVQTAAEHLSQAAATGRTVGLSPSYVASIESMASILSSGAELDASTVDRQTSFIRQVAGVTAVGDAQDGYRYYDGPATLPDNSRTD
jgi:hypothetical protein